MHSRSYQQVEYKADTDVDADDNIESEGAYIHFEKHMVRLNLCSVYTLDDNFSWQRTINNMKLKKNTTWDADNDKKGEGAYVCVWSSQFVEGQRSVRVALHLRHNWQIIRTLEAISALRTDGEQLKRPDLRELNTLIVLRIAKRLPKIIKVIPNT